MWILLIFGTVMASYGVLVMALTYHYRDRGDVVIALVHAAVLVVVGALAVSAALSHSWRAYLIGAFGVLLLVDALVRWHLARKPG